MVALLGWGALGGLSFLVAFRAEDVFGLSPTQRGLLLTGFGVAGILTARLRRRGHRQIGARAAVLIGALGGAILVAVVGPCPLRGDGDRVVCGRNRRVSSSWSVSTRAVLGSPGPNRGGAVSVVQALRFMGNALAPITLTPVYAVSPAAGFLLPAALLAVLAPLLMPRDRAPV